MIINLDRNRFNADHILQDILISEGSTWNRRDYNVLVEEEKIHISENVITLLFNDIKKKAFKVDFSVPERSMGDIIKIENYNALRNALSFLRQMSSRNSKEQLSFVVNTLENTLSILVKYDNEFKLAFKNNNVLLIYLYNSIVIGLIESVSLTIAEVVELTNDSLNYKVPSIKKNIDCNLTENNYVRSLIRFVDMEKNGKLKNTLSKSLNLKEDLMTTGLGILGMFILVLSIIRSIVYMYYSSRNKIAFNLRQLKELLEMNAYTINDKKYKHVRERQLEIAKKFEQWADMISTTNKSINEKTNKEVKQSDKDINNDIKNEKNDSENENILI